MVDATSSDFGRQHTVRKTADLPKPQPFGAPVLISDCITPLCGETVLSLLLKRMARRDLDG
jgi:hypothetical protein